MTVELKQIQESQEEISKILTDFQSAHKALVDEGKSNKDTVENLKNAFGDLSEKHEEHVGKLEAEIKAREAVELALAKVQESGGSPDDIKGSSEYKSSFNSYLRTKAPVDESHVDAELKSMIKSETGVELSDNDFIAMKTLLVGSDPDGGYFVPVERQSVIKKRIFETTPMRQMASIFTIGTEATEFVLDDEEFQSDKVGELDARGNTDTSKIGIITIATKEQYAQPVATQKIVDDAVFNIENWISGKISEKFARVENAETINGSGAHEMEGIATLPSWTTLGEYERGALETRDITGTAGTTIDSDDLLDLQSDLLEPYQGNANFMFHRKVWVEIMKLKDSDGQFLLNPMMLFSGAQMQLLGRPVRMSGDMPDNLNTDGSIIGYYGDFREGYAIVDRIGIRVLRDPYTTKGVIKYYTTKRTGGGVVNYQSIKRLSVPSGT